MESYISCYKEFQKNRSFFENQWLTFLTFITCDWLLNTWKQVILLRSLQGFTKSLKPSVALQHKTINNGFWLWRFFWLLGQKFAALQHVYKLLAADQLRKMFVVKIWQLWPDVVLFFVITALDVWKIGKRMALSHHGALKILVKGTNVHWRVMNDTCMIMFSLWRCVLSMDRQLLPLNLHCTELFNTKLRSYKWKRGFMWA